MQGQSRLLLILMAGLAIAPSALRAQSVLSDYESAAKLDQRQQAAEWRLSFRPSRQVLQQSVSQLETLPRVSESERAQAKDLVQSASNQDDKEAKRTLWHAASILLGRPWNADQELMGSLTLSSGAPVLVGEGDRWTLAPSYLAPAAAKAAYTLTLFKSEPTSSATPKKGAAVKVMASGEVAANGQASQKFDLTGVPDGAYLVICHATSGDASTDISLPIYIVRDLDRRYQLLKSRLSGVKGHHAAVETAEYPFALAQAMIAGKREVISYDFPTAISRSERIADGLRHGRDIVAHAVGLQTRAYRLPETGELIPYQLYVPKAWTSRRKWPLVVALHGANLDETNMLGRADGEMQRLAEQHGFVVVAPLGYRINSGYGSERGPTAKIAPTQRQRLSEADVLHVADLVQAEYSIDTKREYLTGNSMGGGGTWWIGGHYSKRWAAIAPSAFGWVLPEDVPALSQVPIMAVVGDHDELGMLPAVKAAVATLRDGGVSPEYVEVPGGTHASAMDIAMPKIFDFFASHAR